MTLIRFAFLTVIGGLGLSLHAQEAARPTVDLTTKAIEPSPAQATPVPAAPELPELSELDQIFKQTSLGKTADEFRMHIEWRRLRNQVANNPEVIAAKKAAESARTDLEKRERLRQYYKVYYAHMKALTNRPEIKAGLEDMQAKHISLADQNRVRPSPSPSTTPATEQMSPAPATTASPAPNAEENNP
jgi:hypothetical protein